MIRESVLKTTGALKVPYEGNEIDFSKFERLAMRDAILRCKSDAEMMTNL
jgi:lysyl-tRNA synthetase class II